jgi:hypothetical protein
MTQRLCKFYTLGARNPSKLKIIRYLVTASRIFTTISIDNKQSEASPYDSQGYGSDDLDYTDLRQ